MTAALKAVLIRFAKVFIATFLVQLGTGIIGVNGLNAFKIVIISSLSAAIVAVGKAFRESGDNLIGKLL